MESRQRYLAPFPALAGDGVFYIGDVSANRLHDVWVTVLACYGAAQTTFWLIVEHVPGLKDWLYAHFNAGGTAR